MIKSNKARDVLKNVTISVIAIVISVILLEIAISAVLPIPDPNFRPFPYVIDDEVTFRFLSNGEFKQNGITIYTDEYGYRVLAPGDFPRKSDEIILFIGDSQTFGWLTEAEKAFPYKTEAILRENGWGLRVVNTGTPGWGLWTYPKILERVLDTYPNVVAVVMYIVENDWEPIDKFRVEDGYLEDNFKADTARFIPKKFRMFLARFNTWRYLRHAWRASTFRRSSSDSPLFENRDVWIEGLEPIRDYLGILEEHDLPLIVIVDDVLTEIEPIIDTLEAYPAYSITPINEVDGGYLYDWHIDQERHHNLAVQISSQLEEIIYSK